jgi:hypothetical protein
MADRKFDEAIIIRDYDLDTNQTKIYLLPEGAWKNKEFEKSEDDPVLAPILPMISKGALLAAVPETNPQGASCYLINLADLWVNHDPEYGDK